MARVIIYNNIFDKTDSLDFEYDKNISINEMLSDVNADARTYSCMAEVYDPETGETTYCNIEDDIEDRLNIAVNVNGLIKSPDYVIQNGDFIIIDIFPSSEKGVGKALETTGWVLIGAAIIASAAFGVAELAVGLAWTTKWVVGVGLAATAGAALLGLGSALSDDTKGKSKDQTAESNPSISGSSNPSLGDNAFPLVLGTVECSPFTVGSAYNEFEYTGLSTRTFDKSWLGKVQKQTNMIAVGYGPLLVTDIKIDNLPLCSNVNNVISGKMTYKKNSEGKLIDDNGSVVTFDGKSSLSEMGEMWDSNKVSIEISQMGNHRTIYPYAVKQKKLNIPLIYCYDKQYEKIASGSQISWQGQSFPTGMRTNSIQFTEGAPWKIAVGIDFPQGLYWSHSGSSNTSYAKIPLNLIIQWRPVYKGTDRSVVNYSVYDESVTGYDHDNRVHGAWRNFDNKEYNIVPKVTYTSTAIYHSYRYDATRERYVDILTTDGYVDNPTESQLAEGILVELLSSSMGIMKENLAKQYTNLITGASDEYTTYQMVKVNNSSGSKQEVKITLNTGYGKSLLTLFDIWMNKLGFATGENAKRKRYNEYKKEVTVDDLNNFCIANNINTEREYFKTRYPDKETLDNSTSAYEVERNKGLSSGTSSNSNPNWSGVTAFSFGKYSCGEDMYDKHSYDPSTTGDDSFESSIDNVKDEMQFEITTELSRNDILDLINKNPNQDEGSNVLFDSVEVRVLRLTPCYIDKDKDSYQDVVKWSYIKTYCVDTRKLKEDIEATVDFPYETFNISDYKAKPLNDDDMNKLVTVAVEAYPDKLGYIDGQLEKISVKTHSITPFLSSLWTRYWHKEDDVYYYYDSYNSDYKTNIPSFSLSDDRWVKSTEEEYNEEKNDTSHFNTEYNCSIKNENYDKKIFPERINKITALEKAVDVNGNELTDSDGNAILDVVPKNSSWIPYIKKEMSMFKDSIGRWIATDNFKNAFTENNSISQVLSFMCGQALGKDAYTYDTSFNENGIMYWKKNIVTYTQPTKVKVSVKYSYFTWGKSITLGTYSYDEYINDVKRKLTINPTIKNFTATVTETETKTRVEYYRLLTNHPAFDSTFAQNLNITQMEQVNETEFNIHNPESTTVENVYAETVKNSCDFNMLSLKEAYEYTDAIDMGSGPLQYNCNLYVYTQQKVNNLLNTILATCYGFWSYDDKGRIEIRNDKKLLNPVMLITEENCISISNSRSFDKGIAGYHLLFSDGNNGFEQGEIYCLREGQSRYTPTRDIIDLQLQGVTNNIQAAAIGYYMLAQSITQRETWSLKLNHVGNALKKGSLIEMQDSTLLVGTDHSGRILQLIEDENFIYGFIIDSMYEYRCDYDTDGRNKQGCSIYQPGAANSSKVVTIRFASSEMQSTGITVGNTTYKNLKGDTNLVLFERKIIKASKELDFTEEELQDKSLLLTVYQPKEGNVVAFGDVGSITTKSIVYNFTVDQNGKVSVDLYPYYDSVYESSLHMPVYQTTMSVKPISNEVPFNESITRSEVLEVQGDTVTQEQLSNTREELEEEIGKIDSSYILNVMGPNVIKNKSGFSILYPQLLKGATIIEKIPEGYEIKWYINNVVKKTYPENSDIADCKYIITSSDVNNTPLEIQCKLEG